MKSTIYLDNNATTHLDNRVLQCMVETWNKQRGNPASQHKFGRESRRIVEAGRDLIGELCDMQYFGTDTDQVIFTSGGTEANNLAIAGLTAELGTIVVSSVEHPSVLEAAERCRLAGRSVRILPVDEYGVPDLVLLKSWIEKHIHSESPDDRIALVSIMFANNETGVVTPIQEIAAMCNPAGITLHTDAVQALGKIPLSFLDLGVDAMTITAHKLHGPVGIGALLLRHGIELEPQLRGGFQQAGLRPGTEPVALVTGFAKAVDLAVGSITERESHMHALRDEFERCISALVPNAIFVAKKRLRLPQTSCVAFPGLNRQQLQMSLDLEGVACSTGSACASGSSQPSHVLQAMNLPEEIIEGAIRFSLSYETTEEIIVDAANRIATVVHRLQST
jgi:cysteine desulfurase